MSTDTTYNGHANYETWAVSMFLDGNYDGEGRCREVEEMDREAFDEDEAEQDFYAYSQTLKEYVSDSIEQELGGEETQNNASGLAADLLGAALSEVDWMELAEGRLSELVIQAS